MSDRNNIERLNGRKVIWIGYGGAIETGPYSGVDCVILGFDEGPAERLLLFGSCCSKSYFADLNQFKELIGARIMTAEVRDGASSDKIDLHEGENDVWSWHFLVFTTDKGHVTIDWRNESNGYYDGWLEVEPVEMAGA